MLATFVVESCVFLVELVFNAVIELTLGYFFSDSSGIFGGRKSSEGRSSTEHSAEWVVSFIVGLAIFACILVTGFWYTYLRS